MPTFNPLGYFRDLTYNPFELDQTPDVRGDTPPASTYVPPSRRPRPALPPVRSSLGVARPGGEYNPEANMYLSAPMDERQALIDNTRDQEVQAVTDRRKAAEVQAYLEKMARTLPANDPRKSIYDFLLSSQKYEQSVAQGINQLRLARQPRDVTPLPASVERLAAGPDVTPQTIRPGFVFKGYRYVGGNPKDQNSWVKM